MRRIVVPAAVFCLLTPGVCLALAYGESGNKPQSAANYEDWPGLVDVVNDPSRAYLFWCNGDETLWYQGETEDLNRMLEQFAEVDLPERRVVLVPGDGPLNKAEKDAAYDWMLHVVAGIAKGRIDHFQLEKVEDVHPTLTVYVTDRIDLDALEIPEGVTLVQTADLRSRYEDALESGTENERKAAQRLLDRLDEQVDRKGEDARVYKRRLAEIAAFVERQK